MEADDDIIEVNNQIPYRRIEFLTINSVNYVNEILEISYQIKCEGSIKQDYTIIRKLFDLNDLITKMKRFHPHLIIHPAVPTQTSLMWMPIIALKNLIITQTQRQNLDKQERRLFIVRCVERVLDLISNLSIKFIYTVGSVKQSPLFSFFHKNYDLYKSNIYLKEDGGSLQKLKGYFWSGGKMLKQYISKGNSKNQCLVSAQRQLQQKIKNINQLNNEIIKLEKTMEQISNNFLTLSNKLNSRRLSIYRHSVKIGYHSKYIQIMLDELQNITLQFQEKRNQFDVQKQLEPQIKIYSTYLQKQIKLLNQQTVSLVKQFHSILKDHTKFVQINIGEIYTNYKPIQ